MKIRTLPLAEDNYGNLRVGKDIALFYLERVQPRVSNPLPGEPLQADNRLLPAAAKARSQVIQWRWAASAR
ncbi:MAG: hypothetical protein RQ826_00030 [Xanthomonadales bacterium]|nr:hypothetical protein [Xanthomonadales bacterium]